MHTDDWRALTRDWKDGFVARFFKLHEDKAYRSGRSWEQPTKSGKLERIHEFWVPGKSRPCAVLQRNGDMFKVWCGTLQRDELLRGSNAPVIIADDASPRSIGDPLDPCAVGGRIC